MRLLILTGELSFILIKRIKMEKPILFFRSILNQKELYISHRGETILRPMARLKDLFRHIGNTDIDSYLLTNLRTGIMTDYTVR